MVELPNSTEQTPANSTTRSSTCNKFSLTHMGAEKSGRGDYNELVRRSCGFRTRLKNGDFEARRKCFDCGANLLKPGCNCARWWLRWLCSYFVVWCLSNYR